MTKLPIALIYSRLVLGILVMVLSLNHVEHYRVMAIVILTTGLLTDIFDGIIARRLNVSTQTLRRLDSTVDQVFFVSFTIATY
ncbi:MAG TPA: CDP-alcohol phosphatidyltransferase family protein, partial [Catalimonadaceae bacterium]|nr:CDP-alcohol phosphatidyltransferase family protein [Catalimonadaceae bacterium]